jgi:SAM-dependent methyltransferase
MGKMKFTKLERAVFGHPEWRVMSAKIAEIRKRVELGIIDEAQANKEIAALKRETLDNICDEVVAALSPRDLCESTTAVYGDTAEEYGKNPHNTEIIDEFVMLMNMLAPGALMLDLGCAYGRDTFFASVPDPWFRAGYMGRTKEKNGKTTLEKFPVPEHGLRVVGMDGSQSMIEAAKARQAELEKEGMVVGIGHYPRFILGDMHGNFSFLLQERDGSPFRFDGIWSCASLFTHTPRELIGPALANAARALLPGGVFFVSYTNGRSSGRYNKLIPSSTGRIKWFSHPDPDEIVSLAAKNRLKLIEDSTFDDYTRGADLAKDLFASHFFKKEG